MLLARYMFSPKHSKTVFVLRLLQYIDDIISSHKDKLLLNSDEVVVGQTQWLFDTVCIDR